MLCPTLFDTVTRCTLTIHSTAVIDPRAEIDATATIGPYVIIDGPVHIGPGCQIGPSVVILGRTFIGADCRIHSHAVIGDLPQDRAFLGEESTCHIGEGCTIREGVTIHRGTEPGSKTTVGARCHLMTNSHIAHNCEIGEEVTIVSGALLAGHVRVGPRAVVSGNAAIHQYVRIGELAMVSGLAKVVQDIPPFFMTDREGAVVGENRVGLMRAGLSLLERREIKTAFRVIYRSGNDHLTATEYLSGYLSSDAGRRLYDFVTARSKRGLSRDSRALRRAA
jgi:UDP-N-acetylglucosamine acyltransferase